MASSFFTESEAPRDFRVSSTESDGHYTKCLLCYTVKRNFYCPECIRTGNFVHSSMPYADRYAEKQAKLLRVKANRKYILDRCEKLLRPKLKKDTLLTEAKQSRDRLDLLRLAIDQRKNNIEQKKRELTQLKNYNNELQLKLPRYQKRVATLGKHAQHQSIELQNKICVYNDQVESLAALRRSRIRQLTRYIFPIYMTYDASDSIEDMEFIGSDTEEEPPPRAHLHIVAPWITTDGDLSNVQAWLRDSKEPSGGESVGAGGGGGGGGGEGRVPAALALAAQLLALLAWTLDVRLPHALALTEYSRCRAGGGGGGGAGGVEGRARRVCAGAAALALHAAPHCCGGAPRAGGPGGAGAPHPLAALHALVLAAVAGDPALGRAERWSEHPEAWCEWAECWTCSEESVDAEPEHLTWPDWPEPAEGRGAPSPASAPAPAPAPAASLVTSAAASLASMWRGWTK